MSGLSMCTNFSTFWVLAYRRFGTDNSIEVAEQYIQKYTGSIHFMIISHKFNQGQGVARNTGIRAATGDYVFFMDCDDAITPDCIVSLTTLAVKYSDVDFVQGKYYKGNRLSYYTSFPPAGSWVL